MPVLRLNLGKFLRPFRDSAVACRLNLRNMRRLNAELAAIIKEIMQHFAIH